VPFALTDSTSFKIPACPARPVASPANYSPSASTANPASISSSRIAARSTANAGPAQRTASPAWTSSISATPATTRRT
jgi:hypothetical protein